MSHASHSLPGSDRDEAPDITITAEQPLPLQFTTGTGDPLLRQRLAAYQQKGGLSQRTIGAKLAVSSSVVSQWLAGSYPGDVPKLERKVREFLDNEGRRRQAGVETVECPQTMEIRQGLEVIRRTNDVGVIMGEPGVGKTRGIELYRNENPLAILFHVRSWTCDKLAMEGAMTEAVEGWDKKTRRSVWLVQRLANSDRLLIVDDAHKLTRPALQWIFDLHDATGIPIALIGTFALEDKVADDPQRYRRVGYRTELTPDDPAELVGHLVRTLCPGVNGERAKLEELASAIAGRRGHFGDVHKQLKLAGEIKAKTSSLTWEKAVRAAHTKLFRDQPLPK